MGGIAAKILHYLAQFLLIPLIKDFFSWLMAEIKRKREQKRRHEENKQKVEKYANSKDSSDFDNLP